MKTHELISIKEAELVTALKTMQLEEMETHAKNIIKDMGSDNYAGIMKSAMNVIQNAQTGTDRFAMLKQQLKDELPNEAVLSDIYARLATIIMMILSKKLSGIMNKS